MLEIGKLIEKLDLEDDVSITYKLSTGRFKAVTPRKLKKKMTASKLGIHHVVGFGLCKLVADKLFEAEEEVVVLKALVQKADLEAHCSKTMMSQSKAE